MRFDVHLRRGLQEKLEAVASRMSGWEEATRVDADEQRRIVDSIQIFAHTTSREGLVLAGTDGTGDFPTLSYNDSFVHFTLAQATAFAADAASGLREVAPSLSPVFEVTWLPSEEAQCLTSLLGAFSSLAGEEIDTTIERSDYRLLKAAVSGRPNTLSSLRAAMILPQASDAGNLAIQLRSTAELGAALRAIRSVPDLRYMLLDSTLSLPFVQRPDTSLFFEHLKRLCCVEALRAGVGFFALSKSHGLPSIELLEGLAREKAGLPAGKTAEHWFLRLPTLDRDGWDLSLTEGRRLPAPGAVTYLVRYHRTTPVLRLDVDLQFWQQRVHGETSQGTLDNERVLFEDLDYASHDQRCYGYPYPLKAAHDRASLTYAERVALRKMIVDAAVEAGMNRNLFNSASAATGHG